MARSLFPAASRAGASPGRRVAAAAAARPTAGARPGVRHVGGDGRGTGVAGLTHNGGFPLGSGPELGSRLAERSTGKVLGRQKGRPPLRGHWPRSVGGVVHGRPGTCQGRRE